MSRCSTTRPSRRTACSNVPTAPGLGMDLRRGGDEAAQHPRQAEAPHEREEDHDAYPEDASRAGSGSAPPRPRLTAPALAQDAPISIALAARRADRAQPAATASPAATTGRSARCSTRSRSPTTAPSASARGFRADSRRELGDRRTTPRPGPTSCAEGVKFHKGYGEMTSEDVVFTFGRHLDPKIVTSQKALYSNVDSGRGPRPLHGALHPQAARSAVQRHRRDDHVGHPLPSKAFEEKGAELSTWTRSAPVPTRSRASARPKGVMLTAFPDYFDGPAVPRSRRVPLHRRHHRAHAGLRVRPGRHDRRGAHARLDPDDAPALGQRSSTPPRRAASTCCTST